MDSESNKTQSAVVASGEALSSYPVPDTVDAIFIKDGTRIEKGHVPMSVNYKVSFIKAVKRDKGLRGLCDDS